MNELKQKLNLENVSVVSIDGVGHDISSIKSLKLV